ncbi:sugar ABC transporter permease [Angustibacter sp. Root456]|uniref:sugar ABC transporter permease n=1 Tax=Angustibacter sp. Root456 TaxID=1736539 RepID=UPI0006FB56EA|nr:ABC transporter permease [Angustibacter sp. Root456]KQX66789.1 ABC transporter permease [Angustibacter sp. Root456]
MTTATTPSGGPSLAGSDFSGDQRATTLQGATREYVDRLRGGDMGSLPAVLGLIVLFIVFTALRPDTFPSFGNLANLTVQAGAICVLAMGLVPVLLLGEIDLSAGVAGGASAGVMAVLINDHGWPWPVAVLGAVVTGMVIGLAIGLLVARLSIPSFVVTLAFFLGVQGITLKLIGQGGTVPVRSEAIVGIANSNVPVAAGWVLAVLVVILFAAVDLLRLRRQISHRLQHPPVALVVVRIVLVAVVVLAFTYILNANRAHVATFTLAGIPYVVPLVGVLLVLWTFVLGRTTYGRHVYAVGGNAEAARRAGINVRAIRVSVFVIGSSMAALSGIVAASRLNAVTPDAGAGNTLLYAVGAAVIGGTSLFGGRGKPRDAIIGGLVIATIDNGLLLMGFDASINYMVTALVLLLAASVDAISRRRRSATGR